jgi:hypothetical protein
MPYRIIGSQTVTTVKSGGMESVVVVALGVRGGVEGVMGMIVMADVSMLVEVSVSVLVRESRESELEEELGVPGNGTTEMVVMGRIVRSEVGSGKMLNVGEDGRSGAVVASNSSVSVLSTLERMKTVSALVMSREDAVASAGVASNVFVVEISVLSVPNGSENVEVEMPDSSVPGFSEVEESGRSTVTVLVVKKKGIVVRSVTVTVFGCPTAEEFIIDWLHGAALVLMGTGVQSDQGVGLEVLVGLDPLLELIVNVLVPPVSENEPVVLLLQDVVVGSTLLLEAVVEIPESSVGGNVVEAFEFHSADVVCVAEVLEGPMSVVDVLPPSAVEFELEVDVWLPVSVVVESQLMLLVVSEGEGVLVVPLPVLVSVVEELPPPISVLLEGVEVIVSVFVSVLVVFGHDGRGPVPMPPYPLPDALPVGKEIGQSLQMGRPVRVLMFSAPLVHDTSPRKTLEPAESVVNVAQSTIGNVVRLVLDVTLEMVSLLEAVVVSDPLFENEVVIVRKVVLLIVIDVSEILLVDVDSETPDSPVEKPDGIDEHP